MIVEQNTDILQDLEIGEWVMTMYFDELKCDCVTWEFILFKEILN